MSYGLNIEMHKQVQILVCLPLCLHVGFSLSYSPFSSYGWVLMYLACAHVDVHAHACKCIWACVSGSARTRFLKCVCVCLFVIDGALSPFPQLGLAA